MDSTVLVNVVFLCLVNFLFMIAGIFINSVVIITFKRCRQLRKKLCYFTILLLSCIDLAAAIFSHLMRILLAISLSTGTYHKFINWVYVISINLIAFSVSALLVMSVERFLALKYPFFHHTAVTKRRLLLFLAFLMFITVSVSPLLYIRGGKFGNYFLIPSILFSLFLFVYLNYNIFVIARSKRKVDDNISASSHPERRAWKLNLKHISTCSLAVGCFLTFYFPEIVFSVLRSTNALPNERFALLFGSWLHTIATINSTFNCLIFFWRHSILRREGRKTVKHYLCSRPWL
jgi:hypothetical protein